MFGPGERLVGDLDDARVDEATADVRAELAAAFGCDPSEIEVVPERLAHGVRLRGYWTPTPGGCT